MAIEKGLKEFGIDYVYPKDLIMEFSGFLQIISKGPKEGSQPQWWCLCHACGKCKLLKAHDLRAGGKRISCGCLSTRNYGDDLIGKTFSRLTVIRKTKIEHGHWNFLCKCSGTSKYCKGEKEVRGSDLLQGCTTSCGCHRDEVSALGASQRTGDKNGMWKGGVTDINAKIRSSSEYHEWRLAVYARDHYRCRICTKKCTDDIEAHHLNDFMNFPEQRFDVNNGVCLCEDCHQKVHSGKGNMSATREKFNEFLQSLKLPPLEDRI